MIYTSIEELNARLGDGKLMKVFFIRRLPVENPNAAGSRFAQV
jgi:hypothetical protein